MPEPSSFAEASSVAVRQVLDHQRAVGPEHQPGERALAHRPALTLAAADIGAVDREAVQLHAVDLGDLAGVRTEPLGDGLRQPLGELARCRPRPARSGRARGGLAVAGAVVERLGGAALLGDVADLGLQGDGAATLVADEGHGHLSQHVRAVGLPVALLDRVVPHLAGEQRLVQPRWTSMSSGSLKSAMFSPDDLGDLAAQERASAALTSSTVMSRSASAIGVGESSNTRRRRCSATVSEAEPSRAAARARADLRRWAGDVMSGIPEWCVGAIPLRLEPRRATIDVRAGLRSSRPDHHRARARRHRVVPGGACGAVGAVLDRARGRDRARARGGAPGRARRLRGERGSDVADRGGHGPRARERPADPGADRPAARGAAPPRHAACRCRSPPASRSG